MPFGICAGRLERREIFGDVLRQRRDARRLFGIGRIQPQHVAVVLDRRAAAGGGDDDRIEPTPLDLARPDVDIGAGARQRLLLPSHMMDERAAADLALGNNDLDAETA